MAPNDRSNRPLRQPPEPGKWKAFALAVLMHILLAAALIFSLNWNRRTPGPVQAELWTALPSPNQPEPPTPTPEPEPRPAPPPPPPPPPQPKVEQDKPDIAIEQEKKRQEERARREAEEAERKRQQQLEEKRLAAQREQERKEAERKEAERKKAEQLAAEKAAAEKKAAEKAAAEKREAEKKAEAERKIQAERERKLREALRNDAAKAAGLEGGRDGGTANRNQAGGGGGDPGYADLVRACIKPGVIYSASGSPAGGNPTAVFRVQLLPTGAQAGAPRLVRSSGVPAFDRAVENGIRRCDPFPRPSSGRYESNIEVQYRMFD